jgi:hypothetical protein
MKKKAAVVLGAVVAATALAVAATVYAPTEKPRNSSRTEQVHEQGQIQAPPRPLRTKPVERVVVAR